MSDVRVCKECGNVYDLDETPESDTTTCAKCYALWELEHYPFLKKERSDDD